MIKLLTLDLDGTVLDSRGRIPRENLEAIRAAEEAGVLVTIATGRRFRDARPVGIELELNAPLITHNGALLKYAGTLEPVAFSLLESERSYEIIRVGKTFGGDALLSADPHGKGTLLYDRVSDDNVPLQKYLTWSRGLHGDEADDAVHHVAVLEALVVVAGVAEELLHERRSIQLALVGRSIQPAFVGGGHRGDWIGLRGGRLLSDARGNLSVRGYVRLLAHVGTVHTPSCGEEAGALQGGMLPRWEHRRTSMRPGQYTEGAKNGATVPDPPVQAGAPASANVRATAAQAATASRISGSSTHPM